MIANAQTYSDIWQNCLAQIRKQTSEEEFVLDATGKKNGRGAYICKRPECLRKSRKQRRLETSLECTIPDDVYKKLEEELNVDNR